MTEGTHLEQLEELRKTDLTPSAAVGIINDLRHFYLDLIDPNKKTLLGNVLGTSFFELNPQAENLEMVTGGIFVHPRSDEYEVRLVSFSEGNKTPFLLVESKDWKFQLNPAVESADYLPSGESVAGGASANLRLEINDPEVVKKITDEGLGSIKLLTKPLSVVQALQATPNHLKIKTEVRASTEVGNLAAEFDVGLPHSIMGIERGRIEWSLGQKGSDKPPSLVVILYSPKFKEATTPEARQRLLGEFPPDHPLTEIIQELRRTRQEIIDRGEQTRVGFTFSPDQGAAKFIFI